MYSFEFCTEERGKLGLFYFKQKNIHPVAIFAFI